MSATEQGLAAAPAVAGDIEDLGDLLEVGVIVVDDALVVRGWNAWLAAASRRSADSVVGRHIREVIPELTPFAEAALRQATAGASSVLAHRLHKHLLDLPPRDSTGSSQLMQQSIRIVPYATAGMPHGAAALIEDVTERVRHEEDLRAALERAEGANRVKADFLAAMSHELRTPIGAASGYVDLLLEGIFGPLTPEQEATLHRVKAVSAHLLGIVQEILTYSRVEAGREELILADIDATELARSALVAVEPLITRKGIALERGFPESAVPMHSDAVKMRQILINLLGNAMKFTAAGTITVRVEPAGEQVRFIVADTGEGIRPGDLERIFEPFTQLETSLATRRDGTGLGLAVSQQYARLLGGDISVASVRGEGTTFVVALPAKLEAP